MELFEGMLLNLVCVTFPLMVYIICTVYAKNLDRKENHFILDIALYSSCYLLIKFGTSVFIYPLILLNVPLLIAYFKKKTVTAILLSIILVIYYHIKIRIGIFYLGLEYLLYFLCYLGYSIYHKEKANSIMIISIFVVIKSFMISFKIFYFIPEPNNTVFTMIYILSMMLIFTFLVFLIYALLQKGEDAIDLHHIVHELEKEKKLRESLFKITHEIKNPIAVCKGYLDMMDYKDMEKVKKYQAIIKDEINRTLILMDDFLDYTKIKIEKEEVDLYLLVEDTCDVMRPLFHENDIELRLHIPEEEVYMQLDYNRLKQVLVNLLKNSIEARDIRKKKMYIDIHASTDKNFAYLIIKDNGVGMSQKDLEKVDEMFHTTKEKGTGLGVCLSKEIIMQHQGSLTYRSSKGKSTTVTIKLPFQC